MPITIKVPAREFWDERNEMFINTPETSLTLEHSLISISKWETKYHKPFLEKTNELTTEEVIDYIRFMTIGKPVDDYVYLAITKDNVTTISDYIADSCTATTFSNEKRVPRNGEFVTSELIYYWMVAYNIPFECEKWHINRLLTLIKICNVKNEKPKKMGRREHLSKQAALNKARRAKYNSKG